jgi:uncharacterized membrane protein YgdD (TMEM256/DUF423 family)
MDRPRIDPHSRLVLALAGLMGAAGVALGAVAAHLTDSPALSLASSFLLFHAPAVIALCALPYRSRPLQLAAWGLILGATIFCGTLALEALTAIKMRPSPVPLGGSILILSWSLAAVALLRARPVR